MKSSHNNLRLLLEAKNDHIEVERLLDLVFTPKRTLLSSYQLRNSANKVNNLSYVIKDYSKKVVQGQQSFLCDKRLFEESCWLYQVLEYTGR